MKIIKDLLLLRVLQLAGLLLIKKEKKDGRPEDSESGQLTGEEQIKAIFPIYFKI